MSLGIVLTLASTAISAIGSLRQGKAEEQAAEFNATVAEQNAQLATQRAGVAAKQKDRETRLRLGAIRASGGASGGTGTGSVIDILGDVATQGKLEEQEALFEGELEARSFRNTASLDRSAGKNARSASKFRAGSALLGGASSVNKQVTSLSRA